MLASTPAPPLACADQVFSLMSEDQRIGQLFELGLTGDRLGATEITMIRNDHIGSFWFVDRSYAGSAAIHAVASAVQAQASSASTANVRFFIAANQEGGLIQAMQGPGFSRSCRAPGLRQSCKAAPLFGASNSALPASTSTLPR